MSYDVAIIGAGISGLVAAKSLLEQGLRPIILEKSTRLGGLWNYGKEGGSPLYASLKTNISKQMMGLSDFPFPDDFPIFPTHQQVISYVQSYAKTFNLEKVISYGQEVVHIDCSKEAFSITTNKAFYQVNQLIVSTGRFDKAQFPSIKGIDSFNGVKIHSQHYDIPDQFQGKNVLIVGAAASAMDIASELYDSAGSVQISVRNLPWVIPNSINGKPVDHSLTWLKAKIPKRIREVGFKKILIKEYIQRGANPNPALWSFKMPDLDLEKTRLVPNEKMISLLIHKKVKLFPEIKLIQGEKVTFIDDSFSNVDAIIFATGYQTNFPFFKEHIQIKDNYLGLYKHIFHPSLPNLAFIGVANIVGAAFPLVEMQSRLIAQVFAKKVQLPPTIRMVEEIENHKSYCDKQGIDPMRVQALSYLDDVASMIGASPKFIGNQDVWKQLIFGPLTSFRFRLNESGSRSTLAKSNIKKAII